MPSPVVRAAIFVGLFYSVQSQGVSDGSLNIFDALTRTLNCGKFQTIITNGGTETRSLYELTPQLTLFVPNNTAWDLANADLRNKILSLTSMAAADYVKSFTVNTLLESTAITETLVKKSLASNANPIFFFSRQSTTSDIVNPGNAGRTDYFVNGARIIQQNVRAINGIIHVLDRLLEQSSIKYALAYLTKPDDQRPETSTEFYNQFMKHLLPEDYSSAWFPFGEAGPLTLFVPTDAAIQAIPIGKISDLQGEQKRQLARVIRQHFIRGRALYMSFIYHNEGYQSAEGTQITFKKNIYEKYYVQSGGVTAEIVGNLTVANGAIHFVDRVLGFVYYTALEQIQYNNDTSQFYALLNRGRKDIRDFLVVPAGVTVFVPVNSAFTQLQNLPGVDLYNDQGLINKVLQLCLLERGTLFPVTNVFGGYESRFMTRSQYLNYDITVYSQINETWAEGGYVKARVVRPDVGLTNGLIQLVDSVFGIPYRDLPNSVYCEDWLLVTSYLMTVTGLNDFMRDHTLGTSAKPCLDSEYRRSFSVGARPIRTNGTITPLPGCTTFDARCEFTMFVPNGTAMEFFQISRLGQTIMANAPLFQYVMRRHVALNQKIYLDQRSAGYHSFIAHTGEEIRFNKVVSGTRVSYNILFQGKLANIIHADIGATNGVIHIIDDVLYNADDLFWTGSSGTSPRLLDQTTEELSSSSSKGLATTGLRSFNSSSCFSSESLILSSLVFIFLSFPGFSLLLC